MNDARAIALIGLMGAGKTCVARALAGRLGHPVEDLDERVEARAGCTVAEVFAREGETEFRRREGEALEAALAAGARVLACGGGIVLDPGNRARLRERCRVVWLEVSPREAGRRIEADAVSRPLLAGGPVEARLKALLRERAPFYESIAELCVITDGRDPDEVAGVILDALATREKS